jgi:hypothetical protein
LREFLELVALDDVIGEILVEVTEADTAFETGTDFRGIILEALEGDDLTVIDGLAFAYDTSAGVTDDATA